ncbi:sapecin-B-like [Lucilia sericata]|uniref:sapecin-B-like n=1 Tax=Lucilia sericata TaxID=13632 RepID=UPI0018A80823|nr:sapecin-B-like [Lucilia sericata]
MKLLGIFLISFALLLLATINSCRAAETLNQLDEGLLEGYGVDNEGLTLNRQKRLTCQINPALCATHCRIKGYRRSYCSRQKVCTCRR